MTDEDRAVVAREAAAWLTELRGEGLSQRRVGQFHLWLGDARNAAAFEHLTDIWDRLGSVGKITPRPVTNKRPLQATRRRLLATATAGIAGLMLVSGPSRARAFSTRIGQRRDIAVGGARLRLDCQTTVIEIENGHDTVIEMADGQLFAEGDCSAFRLCEAGRFLRFSAGTFNLRRFDGNLTITAISGHLTLIDPVSNTVATLSTGSRIRIADGVVVDIDRPDLRDVTAWLMGRIVFHDARLDEVIREMNRYDPAQLVLADPRLAVRRLSGSYRIGANRMLALAFQTLLPLRASGADPIVLSSL